MTLELRSIHELRGMVSAMGGRLDFGDDKKKLAAKIKSMLDAQLPQPQVMIPDMPEDMRLRIVPPARNLPRDQVIAALSEYTERGMRLSFPRPDQWRMEFMKKHDTGTMRMPLRVIVGCAQQVMEK